METRLEAVRRILDAATGGRNPRHQGKGRFWNFPRDEFVAAVVYGQQVVVPGDPDASALVNALRGRAPFDGSRFPRMPTGGPYVSDFDIVFIEQWIRDRAPDLDSRVLYLSPGDGAGRSREPSGRRASTRLSIPALTAELRRAAGAVAVDCLKRALRAAIKLEFATIPPYLTAYWSIRDGGDVGQTIRGVLIEEMLHMGPACNMLVGVGERPRLNEPDSVPAYPGPLPDEVNPDLIVPLKRLTPSQLKVFMDIEYPEDGLITEARAVGTIGAFYAALLRAFEAADPPLDPAYQRKSRFRGSSRSTIWRTSAARSTSFAAKERGRRRPRKRRRASWPTSTNPARSTSAQSTCEIQRQGRGGTTAPPWRCPPCGRWRTSRPGVISRPARLTPPGS